MFVGLFRSPDETLNPTISAREAVVRFIFSSRHFSLTERRVKAGAFLPDQRGEVSVFRVEGLVDGDIWTIGKSISSSRTLYARGDVGAESVTKIGLDIVPDKLPSRHANIVGWPEDKAKRKILALQLASAATLTLDSQIK